MSMVLQSSSRILGIVHSTLDQLSDSRLQEAIADSFEAQRDALAHVEDCFATLVSQPWEPPVLASFMHGWHDTHLTSSAVTGLAWRVMRCAWHESDADKQHCYFLASQRTLQIIHEDLGLDGPPHAELFYRLATSLCHGDQWTLRSCRIPESWRFRDWVHYQRLQAPDIQEGLLTTVASEIYNHGEYTMLVPVLWQWMEQTLGLSPAQVAHDLEYVTVHSGETESGHFRLGIEAWRYYCEATGLPIDPQAVGRSCTEYLRRLGDVFVALKAVLQSA